MSDELVKFDTLEDCVRNVFGRVMWSHKIQEKQADFYRFWARLLVGSQIVLSAITSAGLISILFTDRYGVKLASAILSCVLTILVAFIKQYDFEKIIQCHRETAVKYLAVKDRLMVLLLRLRLRDGQYFELKECLSSLIEEVNQINSSAPQTSSFAVWRASIALKKSKDDDISDKEVDECLPVSLRKGVGK